MLKNEIIRRIKHVHEVLMDDIRILHSPADTTPQDVAKTITKLYERYFHEMLDNPMFYKEEE